SPGTQNVRVYAAPVQPQISTASLVATWSTGQKLTPAVTVEPKTGVPGPPVVGSGQRPQSLSRDIHRPTRGPQRPDRAAPGGEREVIGPALHRFDNHSPVVAGPPFRVRDAFTKLEVRGDLIERIAAHLQRLHDGKADQPKGAFGVAIGRGSKCRLC